MRENTAAHYRETTRVRGVTQSRNNPHGLHETTLAYTVWRKVGGKVRLFGYSVIPLVSCFLIIDERQKPKAPPHLAELIGARPREQPHWIPQLGEMS